MPSIFTSSKYIWLHSLQKEQGFCFEMRGLRFQREGLFTMNHSWGSACLQRGVPGQLRSQQWRGRQHQSQAGRQPSRLQPKSWHSFAPCQGRASRTPWCQPGTCPSRRDLIRYCHARTWGSTKHRSTQDLQRISEVFQQCESSFLWRMKCQYRSCLAGSRASKHSSPQRGIPSHTGGRTDRPTYRCF